MKEKIFIIILYILPHHFISRCMHYLANCKVSCFKNWCIRNFIQYFQVNMEDAQEPNINYYKNFNHFFTRKLKEEIRPSPQNSNVIISPVDGTISQIGDIQYGRIFQAKKKDYSLIEILGNNLTLANEFSDGKFMTIYLSPKDYHRVHCPIEGVLRTMIHVPGRLYSVNNTSVNHVPNLFTRNERVISIFDTQHGPLAVIMIGAMIVGSIETTWAREVTPIRKKIRTIDYQNKHSTVTLKRSEELGQFKFGSTVILLFGKNKIDWNKDLHANKKILLNQKIATPYQTVEPKSKNEKPNSTSKKSTKNID